MFAKSTWGVLKKMEKMEPETANGKKSLAERLKEIVIKVKRWQKFISAPFFHFFSIPGNEFSGK